MKHRKFAIRTLLAGAAFAAVLGFGISQVVATEIDAPGTPQAGCSSSLCTNACPEFGGDARWNGKRWICYCCG